MERGRGHRRVTGIVDWPVRPGRRLLRFSSGLSSRARTRTRAHAHPDAAAADESRAESVRVSQPTGLSAGFAGMDRADGRLGWKCRA
jgi:hypothetical protein